MERGQADFQGVTAKTKLSHSIFSAIARLYKSQARWKWASATILIILVLSSISSGRRLRARLAEKTSALLPEARDNTVKPFSIPTKWPPPNRPVQCATMSSLRKMFQVCAFSGSHFGLFRDHLKREQAVYSLISRMYDEKEGLKAFVDVGANHGLMSLYAGKSGAYPIIAVEPNRNLAAIVKYTFGQNKFSGDKAVVYNAACLDTDPNGEIVHLTKQHIGEGGVGTVLRKKSKKIFSTEHAYSQHVRAAPLSNFMPPVDVPVGILKIDVEGHELGVLRSLLSSMNTNGVKGEKQVENIVIEYGPPSRWKATTGGIENSNTAAHIMATLRDRGYGIRILPSFAMPEFLRQPVSSEAKRQPYRSTMGVIVEDDWFVLNAMAVCDCEAYLWLYRDPINGTYDAVVKERWRNSGTSLLIPVSEWLSLGRITFWLACCIPLFCIMRVLQELYENHIRVKQLRKKRKARKARQMKHTRTVDTIALTAGKEVGAV